MTLPDLTLDDLELKFPGRMLKICMKWNAGNGDAARRRFPAIYEQHERLAKMHPPTGRKLMECNNPEFEKVGIVVCHTT